MEGVHRIEDHGRGTGAAERGGDLLADVARLADTQHDDLPAGRKCRAHQRHSPVEGLVQGASDGAQGGQFNIEDLTGEFQMAHLATVSPVGLRINGSTGSTGFRAGVEGFL